METEQLKYIVEAALLAAARPRSGHVARPVRVEDPPERDDLRAAIVALQADYENRGITVQEVASGFVSSCGQPCPAGCPISGRSGRATSRALLETLAIIAIGSR
jgi:segregation and condensation protein B